MADVQLPQLGESVTEGIITAWLVSPGDTVTVDQPIVEISTDKVDTEIPSPVAGTVAELRAAVDETVQVGQVIAVITADANATPAPAASSTCACRPPPQQHPHRPPPHQHPHPHRHRRLSRPRPRTRPQHPAPTVTVVSARATTTSTSSSSVAARAATRPPCVPPSSAWRSHSSSARRSAGPACTGAASRRRRCSRPLRSPSPRTRRATSASRSTPRASASTWPR